MLSTPAANLPCRERGSPPQRSPFFPHLPPLSTIPPHFEPQTSPNAPPHRSPQSRTTRIRLPTLPPDPGPTPSDERTDRVRRFHSSQRDQARVAARRETTSSATDAGSVAIGASSVGAGRVDGSSNSTSRDGSYDEYQQHCRRAACTRPALADPNEFATADEHFTSADTVEADEPRPRRADHRSVVDAHVVGRRLRSDRRHEMASQPHHRSMHVVGPPGRRLRARSRRST